MTDAPSIAVWRELVRRRDPRLRDRMVLAHTPLVRARVARLAARLPVPVDRQDLEAAGFEGLLQAVDRYDPERGTSFEAFAVAHIDGRMLDELRSQDWVPRSVRSRAEQLRRLVELDGSEEVADEQAEQPEREACRNDLADVVSASLRALPLRDALVLQLHYFEELSLAEIAGLLGITPSRAHALHVRSLAELHGALEDLLGTDALDAASLLDAA
jgi:RNA polymerase sigma factor FliA